MRLLAFVLTFMVALAGFCANRADSVKVYFRSGHRQFDPSLENNRKAMDGFIDKVREAVAADDIERIVVYGYASPEGVVKANELLARNRCASIAEYIEAHAGVSGGLIEQIPQGIAWDELRRLVAGTPDVPARESILHILDNTPVWVFDAKGQVIDGRKKQLMDLRGGRPYKWMFTHLFPLLRNGVGIILYLKEKPDTTDEPAKPSDVSDVSHVHDLPETAGTLETPGRPDTTATTATPPYAPVVTEYELHPRHFALKTNILYDAALMPNLEFEWLINPRWSVSLEGDVAWWKMGAAKIYRLAMLSPEARYHINPRGLWHGMYVGAFVGGGWYQLENDGDGYRGEGAMGGFSFGYMWPIGRHFSLEAGIGAGYMRTRYKVYEPREGHLLYMRTKTLDYFGPLKLKFSIAWRFDIIKKTPKVNSPL